MVVEWPLVHWSHAGCYGQQHGWFYVNDDDDDMRRQANAGARSHPLISVTSPAASSCLQHDAKWSGCA
jgi:hypothetical protein